MEYEEIRYLYLEALSKKIKKNYQEIFIDVGHNKLCINLVCSDQNYAANILRKRFEFIDFLNVYDYPRSITEPLLKSYVEDDYMDCYWQMLSPKEFLARRMIAFMKSPKGKVLRFLHEF